MRLHQRILTTEKDFMRLKDSLDNVSYLPIETQFIWDEDKFKDNIIKVCEGVFLALNTVLGNTVILR